MKSPLRFVLTDIDVVTRALVMQADSVCLGLWAKACAERVLPFLEHQCPDERRPHRALDVLQVWIDTGRFQMAAIRKASLDAHAAARTMGADSPARSAARAAGQAVATAHVRTHALGAAQYALQALDRATAPADAPARLAQERDWQRAKLQDLLGGAGLR